MKLNPDGVSVTYTPGSVTGVVTFAYVVSDYRGGWATGRVVVTVFNTPPVPQNMVLIDVGPGGVLFQMGWSKVAPGNVKLHMPEHYVRITRNYYMDKYEVTKELWDHVFSWAITNGYKFEGCVAAGRGPDHPVYKVTWFDAAKWCNARSEMEGLTPVYYNNDAQTSVFRESKLHITASKCKQLADGYRLPTEAEWELAATGAALPGQAGEEDYYPMDESAGPLSQFAVYKASSTAPVGSKKPGNHGLYDMAGNVFEWCFEVNYLYVNTTSSNPHVDPWQPNLNGRFISTEGNFMHIARGGSYLSNEHRANSWRRHRMWEQWARNRAPLNQQFGFRTVRTAR